MHTLLKLSTALTILLALSSCKNTSTQDSLTTAQSEAQAYLKEVAKTYTNLEQFTDQFVFGEKASPTSVFFGNDNTFEVYTNAGGCTTGSCPMTRIKIDNDSLYQEMLGYCISNPLDTDPVTMVQSMNGYIPLPPQLHLKYNHDDITALANGLTYEKLIEPGIESVQKENNHTALLIKATNGNATAYFNKDTNILDSLQMNYIPANIATEKATDIIVHFEHSRPNNQQISYDFSNLKKAERPLQIFGQWLNGKELVQGKTMADVTDFRVIETGQNEPVNFKDIVSGKNTIISIWDTDFIPATWNIRDFQKLKNKVSDKYADLQYISIARYKENISVENIEKFKDVFDINIPSYIATEQYFQKLKVASFPAYIVIDASGNVINGYYGYDTQEIVDLENDIRSMYPTS